MSALGTLPPQIARSRVLGTRDAASYLGLGTSTFRRMNSLGTVPKPIKLSARKLGWRTGDLTDWLDCRETGREWKDCKGAKADMRRAA